jgi:hypothetical protein
MECARPKFPIQTQNVEKRITQEKAQIVFIQETKCDRDLMGKTAKNI